MVDSNWTRIFEQDGITKVRYVLRTYVRHMHMLTSISLPGLGLWTVIYVVTTPYMGSISLHLIELVANTPPTILIASEIAFPPRSISQNSIMRVQIPDLSVSPPLACMWVIFANICTWVSLLWLQADSTAIRNWLTLNAYSILQGACSSNHDEAWLKAKVFIHILISILNTWVESRTVWMRRRFSTGWGKGVVLFKGGIWWVINMYLTGYCWECQITTVNPGLDSLAWGSYTMNFGSEFSWLPRQRFLGSQNDHSNSRRGRSIM